MECTPNNQVCTGLPIGTGFTPENYARRHAPEFASGSPYNPFKLDIWQLGTSVTTQFQVGMIHKIILHVIYAVPEVSDPYN